MIASYIHLGGKVGDMLVTCRPNSQMSAYFADMPLSWQHKIDPDTTFFVLVIANIHPIFSKYQSYLLRNPCKNWYVDIFNNPFSQGTKLKFFSATVQSSSSHLAAASNNICCRSIIYSNNIEPAHPYQSFSR